MAQEKNSSTDGDNRVFRVTVRFKKTEFDRIKARVGHTYSGEMAAYFRLVLLEKPIRILHRNQSLDDHIKELSRMRSELNALGKNFNQVVKKVNATAGKPAFSFWVQQATSMEKELLRRVAAIQQIIENYAVKWFAESSQDQTSGG